MDLNRKMCGHDNGDPDIPAGNYSQFFNSDADPLYDTLVNIFNLSEETASFVVNRIIQVL